MKIVKLLILGLLLVGCSGEEPHSVIINDYWYNYDKDRCVKICKVVGYKHGTIIYKEGNPFDTKTCGCKRESGSATYFKYLRLVEE